jgi:hypothetical protein
MAHHIVDAHPSAASMTADVCCLLHVLSEHIETERRWINLCNHLRRLLNILEADNRKDGTKDLFSQERIIGLQIGDESWFDEESGFVRVAARNDIATGGGDQTADTREVTLVDDTSKVFMVLGLGVVVLLDGLATG